MKYKLKKFIYGFCNFLILVKDLEDLLKIYEFKSFIFMDMFFYMFLVEFILLFELKEFNKVINNV